jgi:amidase
VAVSDLWRLDATAQAALVREKSVRPIELVEAAIARIESLNPKLNAVVTPMFDRARAEASVAAADGPFAGVPFLLKDLLAEYAGVRFTEGSAFLDGRYTPDADSELTRRLRRAGLIVVGKTNTPELGILPTTEPRLFGPTRNPWSLGRTPGDSSGGSAAAVAAGLVAMAHANDGGRSIRIPASCCGLFGLKPTRGRNPLGPIYGDVFSGLAVEHAVTRSVRDTAALLDATAGPDVGDPYTAPAPVRPYLEEISRPPGFLRIAFTSRAATGVPVHAECVGAVQDAARLRADLGHDVTEASLELEGDLIGQAFITVWAAGVAWSIDDWARRTSQMPSADRFEPLTWALYEMGNQPAGRALLPRIRRLALADAGGAAAAARHLRSDTGQSDAGHLPRGAVRAVHTDLQCDRPAGDVGAALLEPRRAADRRAIRGTLWRRGDSLSAGGAARTSTSLGRPVAEPGSGRP